MATPHLLLCALSVRQSACTPVGSHVGIVNLRCFRFDIRPSVLRYASVGTLQDRIVAGLRDATLVLSVRTWCYVTFVFRI